MLLYNEKLEIKNDEGEILYTIKNLTLDAEYELDGLSYKIQETREKLLSGDKFITLSESDKKMSNKYFDYLVKSVDDTNTDVQKIKYKQLANELWTKMNNIDIKHEKQGKKILQDNDILHALPKEFLIESVKWLKDNIEGFEQLGYYECATEINKISVAFTNYKYNLKKK